MKTSPDPRVEDLVRAGRVRVALFPPMYTKNPRTGEFGGVAMDLTRALAVRLGIQVRPVEFPSPGAVVEGLNGGACDIAFLVVNESRADVLDFSPPYAQRDFTYLVPAASPIRSIADADRPGVRIAAVRTHASERALNGVLRRAEVVHTEALDTAIGWLSNGKVDAVASARQDLLKYSTQLPGCRVLEDRYGFSLAAIAVPKGNAGRLSYISDFIEGAKASGIVQQALERSGESGVQVPARGNCR